MSYEVAYCRPHRGPRSSPLAANLARLSIVPTASQLLVVNNHEHVLTELGSTLGDRNAPIARRQAYVIVTHHARTRAECWPGSTCPRVNDWCSHAAGEAVAGDRKWRTTCSPVYQVWIDKAKRRPGPEWQKQAFPWACNGQRTDGHREAIKSKNEDLATLSQDVKLGCVHAPHIRLSAPLGLQKRAWQFEVRSLIGGTNHRRAEIRIGEHHICGRRRHGDFQVDQPVRDRLRIRLGTLRRDIRHEDDNHHQHGNRQGYCPALHDFLPAANVRQAKVADISFLTSKTGGIVH